MSCATESENFSPVRFDLLFSGALSASVTGLLPKTFKGVLAGIATIAFGVDAGANVCVVCAEAIEGAPNVAATSAA